MGGGVPRRWWCVWFQPGRKDYRSREGRPSRTVNEDVLPTGVGDAPFGMPRPDNLPARRRAECYTISEAR